MAMPLVSASTAACTGPPDAHAMETSPFCQCCQVACHRFRPAKPCSFCHAQVCQFCSCGSEPHVLCKSCQPQVRGAQPAFSFRQLLWRFKMLPFGCRGEKWLFLVRKRQSFVVPTDLTADDYQWLVHHLSKQRRLQGAQLEQKRTLDRDVDRTFQQLQIRIANSKRSNFLTKSQYSTSDLNAWKSNTHQLLSVFLMLKPQIGYCQGMTSVAAVLVQESKMNSEMAFRLFLALSEKYRLDDVYRPDMKDVNLRYFQLDEALRLHLPRLHAHLSDRDIHPSTYASCWILTLFTECRLFPHRYVIAFLDLFFEFGWKVFFQTCLAVFSIIEVLYALCNHLIRFLRETISLNPCRLHSYASQHLKTSSPTYRKLTGSIDTSPTATSTVFLRLRELSISRALSWTCCKVNTPPRPA
ncbi:hypothetical protein PPTG_00816 [Phytophthora nicotianae INRA-310]|uniref:Rab-GAP TBC domain-containing protein n=2 Tax=Phytophthora nicotianae (strain INRA-310) TaxID=761204 RepID=W2RH37_PHYN3|nr:hypothetical protein PPTG_00816 [Phytophthora nicotianae INRA-310]ETN24541.1 hypothetical protein PPTG_00816 [Phytophthora nicotianae INRA-310]